MALQSISSQTDQPVSSRPAPELLARARGNPAAFGALVRYYESMVFSMAYHFLHDRGTAEDLAQEVFLSLFKNLDSIQSDSHLKFWLRQVTSRRCIDWNRRNSLRRFMSLEDIAEPQTQVSSSDPALDIRLRRLIATLPARSRAIMVLRFQEDLNIEEIASLLQLSANTVKSSLRRALELLRAKLDRKPLPRESSPGRSVGGSCNGV